MTLKFVIGIPPVTKKNHGQIIYVGGHPRMIPSKQYTQYEKDCAPFIPKLEKPIDFPVNIQAVFYKQTRRASDLTNHLEALNDMLVRYGVLADDNRNIVYTLNNSKVLWDKENPRTEVLITDVPFEEFERW